ncbi:MAG: DUF480 domain-containing protein [Planctomycetes bacterium]|nr:DUF480 domain-containing protein [Planctomycetota bacterium]
MDSAESNLPPITSLTPSQRRVLGTMIEKGLTVPESYPLTLKALTTGCNQKSARHPITNYSEDDVEETLNKLRALGLAAVVHTESGRTERFRHYARKRFSELSEPQVAILAELLLRGRQPMGELRSRASRMAPAGSLDSIDQLRTELSGLLKMNLIQSDGSLERRGIEIDHNLYEAREGKKLEQRTSFDDEPAAPAPSVPTYVSQSSVVAQPAPTPLPVAAAATPTNSSELLSRIAALEATCASLRAENRELREDFEGLQKSLDDLRQALGA